jgi:hypothetical protein
VLRWYLRGPVEVSCKHFKTAAFNHSATSPRFWPTLFYIAFYEFYIAFSDAARLPEGDESEGGCSLVAVGREQRLRGRAHFSPTSRGPGCATGPRLQPQDSGDRAYVEDRPERTRRRRRSRPVHARSQGSSRSRLRARRRPDRRGFQVHHRRADRARHEPRRYRSGDDRQRSRPSLQRSRRRLPARERRRLRPYAARGRSSGETITSTGRDYFSSSDDSSSSDDDFDSGGGDFGGAAPPEAGSPRSFQISVS